MMPSPDGGIFLERRSYRRRRLVDAMKLLPLIGFWLVLLPLWWPSTSTDGADGPAMSFALGYIFSVWAVLIALSATLVLARRLSSRSARTTKTDAPE